MIQWCVQFLLNKDRTEVFSYKTIHALIKSVQSTDKPSSLFFVKMQVIQGAFRLVILLYKNTGLLNVSFGI
ncbi:MAG: hypothetical protein CHH17_10690 [Candidatus Fluviicola riflensis]|nr:MAG: hypothetical protein CHH17_10690 [Candidatus Fluviicola riflensis]